MRAFLLLLAFAVPAAAADSDTACASLYTYLSQSAQANAIPGDGFDAGALKAEEAHLMQNPTEDRERYLQSVIAGAAAIRDGLARRTISTDTVMATATRCNSHYFPDSAAAELSWPDDPWDGASHAMR